jgi:lipoprotein-anchoring transpeptidase ErfK/SrfK
MCASSSILRAAIAGAVALFGAVAAQAQVSVHINKASQTMNVTVDGSHYATWAVSTATKGYRTPSGSFRAHRLERMWYSRKYDMSPMPHSIFFLGGYAIHGTGAIRSLGRPASHGCVRLHPSNAAALFNMVRERGMRSARITIS